MAYHQTGHSPSRSSQCHPESDVTVPLDDGVGHDTPDPDQRQEHGDLSKDQQNSRAKPFLPERLPPYVTHRPCIDVSLRFEASDNHPDSRARTIIVAEVPGTLA